MNWKCHKIMFYSQLNIENTSNIKREKKSTFSLYKKCKVTLNLIAGKQKKL